MSFKWWQWVAKCEALQQFHLPTVIDRFKQFEDYYRLNNVPTHTVCFGTSYILTSKMCHSKNLPIVGAYGYSSLYAQRNFFEDTTIGFWNAFKTDLFAENQENDTIHEMYLFRLNQPKKRLKGKSVHDIVIEKLNDKYIIYQSSDNYFGLLQWIDVNDNVGIIESKYNNRNNAEFIIKKFEKIYNSARNKYGKSKTLNQNEMIKYIDCLEQYSNLGIKQFKMKKAIDPYDVNQNEFDLLYNCYWMFALENYKLDVDDDVFVILNKRPNDEELNIDIDKLENDGYFINEELQDIAYYEALTSFGLAQLFGFVPDGDIDEINVEVYDLLKRTKKRKNIKRKIRGYTPRTVVNEEGNIVCC